ncbi:MAG: maleate cis-trans isomerase [Thermoprotei archaeon]|nr:MAG: maleate cis-trans isomerase [Thermoprotei archaeon]
MPGTCREWRYRIGVIYIASSTVLEREWKAVLPCEVSFHVARIRLRDGGEATRDSIWGMVSSKQVEQAAEMLGEAGVDIIAFACTIGSLIGGHEWDRRLSERIEKVAGVRATTTSTEVVNALKTLGCRTLTVVTPYIEELNALEKRFLEHHGFQVLSIKGFNKRYDQDIARITPDEIRSLVREVDTPQANCIFLSCTNMRSLEAIETLEKELGKPVISSNSATLWGCLKKLGYGRPIKGYGVLLEKYL